MQGLINKFKHVRFIGAGGIGMSALIRVIEDQKNLGYVQDDLTITKSDNAWHDNDPFTDDIDLAVVSTAIPANDSELISLKQKAIPIWHRSDMLLCLSKLQKQKNIVVSGTHGKTTCSAMVSHILMHAGKDPSFVVGGILSDYETNGRAGKGEHFVLEGDESDRSFLKTYPDTVMLTSVEPDHLENYPGGIEEISDCFETFITSGEKAVVCIDDEIAAKLCEETKAKTDLMTYSATEQSADFYLDINSKTVFHKAKNNPGHASFGKLELDHLFGDYNFLNALGAIATAHAAAGVSVEDGIKAMKSFRGIKRRLEFIGDYKVNRTAPNGAVTTVAKIAVYDDYAHHPTEVKALLEGAIEQVEKEGKHERLVFVYQPHHPRRTQDLWDDFVEAFKDFAKESKYGHKALIADIYVARSGHIEGISSKRLVEEINNPNVGYLAFDDARFDSDDDSIIQSIKSEIEKHIKDGDMLLCVGAGNITKVANAFKS